jgi:hypothetical protein
MKKIVLCWSLAALALSSGCSKDTLTNLTNISFFYTYREDLQLPEEATSRTSTSRPLGISVPLPPFTYTFSTGIDEIAADNNTSREKLVSVKVDSLYMQAVAPTSQNFDFIDQVQLYVSAKGVPEVLVGEKIPVPKGQSTLHLDAKDVELKPYFLQDSITLRVQATVNALPALGTTVRFGNGYKITANPLK